MTKKTTHRPWSVSQSKLLKQLTTSATGLNSTAASTRLAKTGPNVLPQEKTSSWWASLIYSFKDPLALILLGAALISGTIGVFNHDSDSINNFILLTGIVAVMALVAFFTDRQADKALAKLKELQRAYSRVFRDGKVVEIEASSLVPGDVILLQEGDKVPADGRVISADRVEINEALLTGESVPVSKKPGVLKLDVALSDRHNMVYSGTYLEAGTCTAVVTATGVHTQLGSIWTQLQTTQEGETPLQRQLNQLGQLLMWGTLVVCTGVVLIYVLRGQPILEAMILAVALAIAFIPEALGAVITIALALGVKEMVRHNTIIKKLRAAEGLGSVSVVCTDKTGTITFGKMTATHLWTASLGSRPINDDNDFFGHNQVSRLVTVAHLCNDLGNPTERALAELALSAGFEITADSRRTRVHEIGFTSDRKMMTTVTDINGNLMALTKGAPDRLVDICTHILAAGGKRRLNTRLRNQIRNAVTQYETQGYRVLGFADREVDHQYDPKRIEEQLTFIGLVALSDPARPEVKVTVAKMRRAGIAAVMITGDSPLTALSIAKDVGIVPAQATAADVLLGQDIDQMTTKGLAAMTAKDIARVAKCRVFARTSPTNKVNIVRILQRAGKLVAMSGDGVNDAPSLKQADVGICMSTGTEVAKEVADVVLTGTYSAIVEAVEVGRAILHRTRLYSHALLSTNGAEVLLFVVAAIANWSAPLTAVQLLLINVLGDSWLSIALATEKSEADSMDQPPRRSNESIITNYIFGSVVWQSIITASILALAWVWAGNYALSAGLTGEAVVTLQRSIVFSTFIVQKVLRSSFTARSLKYNLWQIGIFSNPWTLLAALATVLMAVAAWYLPVLRLVPVPRGLWSILTLGLVPPIVEELIKIALRQKRIALIPPTPAKWPAQTPQNYYLR